LNQSSSCSELERERQVTVTATRRSPSGYLTVILPHELRVWENRRKTAVHRFLTPPSRNRQRSWSTASHGLKVPRLFPMATGH